LDSYERLLWWLFAGSAGAKTRALVLFSLKEQPKNAQQLSQSLAQSSGLGGEGSAGGSGGAGEEEGGASEAGGGELEALLPQTLTEGVMRAGGIGLAAQLMNTLDPTASGQAPSGAPVTAAATPGAATNASQPVSPSGGSAAAAPASSSAASGGTSA